MLPRIDLRSDTVTRPDEAMYDALRRAPLGDDVFGDDPTTRALEERAAERLGKEAAIFVPSGTMANSIAIAVSTRPGDEVLCDELCHSLLFEAAGGARLWGVQMTGIPSRRGQLPLEALRQRIKPDDVHLARTRLVVLEQTSNLAGGALLPLAHIEEVAAFCREQGLALHLDGARIFNAEVALGIPARRLAAEAHTVMFCLSKGLGAPAGSVLLGPTEAIGEGRRVRKLLGGGLRQSGILAACGLHALERNVPDLARDHEHARGLARAIEEASIPGVKVEPPETNMVYVSLEGATREQYQGVVESLARDGVLALCVLGRALRFVFHRDVGREAADQARASIISRLEQWRGRPR